MEQVARRFITGCLLTLVLLSRAQAHNGRGFEIEVVQGKLQAQGINSGEPDGLAPVRPYINSIHDHWRYIAGLDTSIASLPEFEVLPLVAASSLTDYSLDLNWDAAWQWNAPPTMPMPGTIPTLEPLDVGEILSIQTLGAPITSETLGTLGLSESIPAAGTGDIIPLYSIAGSPTNKIHVLQFTLSATPADDSSPSIENSDPIYVMLSPDGVGHIERVHHASLYLEEYLAVNGVPVPEPSSMAITLLSVCSLLGLRVRT